MQAANNFDYCGADRESRNRRRADILVRSKVRKVGRFENSQGPRIALRCCGQECPRAGNGKPKPPDSRTPAWVSSVGIMQPSCIHYATITQLSCNHYVMIRQP